MLFECCLFQYSNNHFVKHCVILGGKRLEIPKLLGHIYFENNNWFDQLEW
jgi:hypothetical protein